MEMYAPAFEHCLDPKLGLPETLEEVLLNRTSYTQAFVEQQAKLNEQKFLAIARSHDMLKTHLEQSLRLRNNEIESRMTTVEEKVERCLNKINSVLDRLTECESLQNLKTFIQPVKRRIDIMEQKIMEQHDYFELNTNEVVKRVVAAIKEEQVGRKLFEDKMRQEKEELDSKLDLVFNKIENLLKDAKSNNNNKNYKKYNKTNSNNQQRKPRTNSSPSYNNEKRFLSSPKNLSNSSSSRKFLRRSRSHSDVPYYNDISPSNININTSGSDRLLRSGSLGSSRFKDSNNMESPTNKINDKKSSPKAAAKTLLKKLSSSKITKDKKESVSINNNNNNNSAIQKNNQNQPKKVIQNLPIRDIEDDNDIQAVNDEYTDSNSSGSFSDDEDTPPPNFQPWMKDQNLKTSSNRNSNKASNLIVAKKKKSSGWGALKSLFRNNKKKKK